MDVCVWYWLIAELVYVIQRYFPKLGFLFSYGKQLDQEVNLPGGPNSQKKTTRSGLSWLLFERFLPHRVVWPSFYLVGTYCTAAMLIVGYPK
jgi:hypothetical protein